MASASFNGSIGSATSLNTSPSVSLSRVGSISGIVTGLRATLNFSTTAYSNYYDVSVTLFYSGGSVSASDTIKLDSSNYTNAQFDFWFPTITAEQANSIYAVSASCGSNGSRVFLKGMQYVYCDYTIPTRCGAPSAASLASAVTTAATNTLTWSGASAGSSNPIKGYFVQYSDSKDGQNWNGWGEYDGATTSATGHSMSVNMPAVGTYRKFKIWTLGSVGDYGEYDSDTGTETAAVYRAHTPATPTSLSPAAGGYASLNSVSWAPVSCPDAVTSYQYQISTDNGVSWGQILSTNATSANISSIFPSASSSARIRLRVRAVTNKGISSAWATSGTYYRLIPPTPPTTFTASPASFESGNVALAWSGTTDADANVNGYLIQYATSANGSSWSGWADLKTVPTTAYSGSTTDAPTMDRGTYRIYRIRAQDSAGLSSGWKESNTVYRARAATTPSILSPNTGHYETAPALSWSPSTAPDGNLAGYEYQISTNGGSSWGTARTTTGTTGIFPEFASAARGTSFRFRVRAYTALKAYSDWATSTVFYKNTAIAAPTVTAPVTSRTIRAFQLRIIVSVAAKSNGIAQTLYYKWNSGGNWTALVSNATGAFKRVLTASISSSGTINLYLRLTDAAGAAIETSVSFSVIRPTFTDAMLVPGTTPTKAVHLNEIREIVDSLRAAYGLNSTAWNEQIAAGTTSLRRYNEHVREIRSGIAAIVSRINSLAGHTLVNTPSWCALSESGPKAEAITEIRNTLMGI